MILQSINSPEDLKKLPGDQLPRLASEIRTKIIEVPMPDEITGGHNGKLALSFENAIKEQIVKYISQTQTNIEVLKQLI